MEFAYIIFLIIAYIGAVVSTVVGFGSGLITLPFASLVVDIKKAVVIITIYYLALNISKSWMFRKSIDWTVVKYLLIGQLPGVILGASAFLIIPAPILKKILGLYVLFYVINSLVKILPKINVGFREIVLTGFFYSLVSGLVGTGAAIKAPTLIAKGLYKESFTGTHSITSVFNQIIKLSIYVMGGMLTAGDFHFGLILSVIGIIGVHTGKLLLGNVTPQLFRRLVLVMLTVASIKLLI